MAKELTVNNYMEALLRAALLLGDLHRTVPVREITISGFLIRNHIRKLYPRCRIAAQSELGAYPTLTVITSPPAEDYLILYPIRNHSHSIPS